jgi:hypothetical protein
VLTLSQIEQGHYSCFLVLWRVSGEDLLDELFILRRELEGD